MIRINLDLLDDEPARLRKRAEGHRRIANMLSSPTDAEAVLQEALRADEEAKRLEEYVRIRY